MKKITAILLVVFMIASLFISCDNSVALTETVSINFDDVSTSRSLNSSLQKFEKGELYWKYEATKADTTGLISGQTSKPEKINGDNKGLGTVSGFSQGTWNFKLYAYTDVEFKKLAYEGEATNVVIQKGSSNNVSIQVSPVKSADKGTLILSDEIKLTPKKQTQEPITPTKVFTVTKLGDNTPLSSIDTNTYELDPGAYKVKVDFVNDGLTFASGSVVATVYSNITTTVQGDLNELLTKATFDSSINPDVMNVEVGSEVKSVNQITAPVTIGKAEDDVKATVPVASVTDIVKEVVGENVPSDAKVRIALTVDTTAATSTSLSLEIGMQATVTHTNDTLQETKPIKTQLTEAVTVTVQLQKNLKNVTVFHNNREMDKDDYSYNPTTGILTITTDSFSPFKITFDAPEFIAEMNGVMYKSLQDAINAAPTDGTVTTIKLLKDVADGAAFGFSDSMAKSNRNILLDLSGYTYSFKEPAMGSKGYETQAMHLAKGNTLHVKNGKMDIAQDQFNMKMFIQNYCDLTLEDVVVDGTNLLDPDAPEYTMSNNHGNVRITGNTQIIAKPNTGVAFDVWYHSGYADGLTITFDENFTGTVTGPFEYGTNNATINKDAVEKAKLIIKNGTFNGALRISGKLLDTDQTGIEIANGIIDGVKLGFAGGMGTENDPYEISTLEQLRNVNKFNNCNFYYELVNDIDLRNETFTSEYIINHFKGSLDGNNNKIYTPSTGLKAIIGKYDSSEFKNIQMVESDGHLVLLLEVAGQWDVDTLTIDNVDYSSTDDKYYQLEHNGSLYFTYNYSFSPKYNSPDGFAPHTHWRGVYIISNCDVNMNLRGADSSNSAVFVGAYCYLKTADTSVEVKDCSYSGTFKGNYVALVLSNGQNYYDRHIEISGLKNNGILIGLNGAYAVGGQLHSGECPKKHSEFYDAVQDTAGGNYISGENTTSYIINDKGNIVINETAQHAAKYVIHMYAGRVVYASNGISYGSNYNYGIKFDAVVGENEVKKYQFVDKETALKNNLIEASQLTTNWLDVKNEFSVNDKYQIVTNGDKSYYVFDFGPRDNGETFTIRLQNPTIEIYSYDADGKLIGVGTLQK